MIQLIDEGKYQLIETKKQTKILSLNDTVYAWIMADDIGEILVTSHHAHTIDHILSIGKYRVYAVKNEASLTDLKHLELLVGDGKWQGYLLPTGFPNDKKTKSRIIPTKEVITKATR